MDRQWLQASGYAAIFLMPALLLAGTVAGKPWLAFGVVVFIFPLARLALGALPAQAPRWREDVATVIDRLPVMYVPLLAASVLVSLAMLNASSPDGLDLVGFGLSLWMTLLFGTCVSHELFHRRDARQATLGHVLAGLCAYPLLGVEHLAHHARPGDTQRAEVPRLDESVWGFAGRRLKRIAGEFWGPHAAVWSAHASTPTTRRLRWAMATAVVMGAAFGALAGGIGLLLFVAVAAGVAAGVQLITYLQHWGLGDDSIAERVGYGRGWEEDCRFQAWITLNISLHDVHHRDSRLPFYRLAMSPDSPRLPASYVVLMFASLVPPLWFSLMRPALAHWLRAPGEPVSAGRRLTCFGMYSGQGVR